jgi:hypothetical protein
VPVLFLWLEFRCTGCRKKTGSLRGALDAVWGFSKTLIYLARG